MGLCVPDSHTSGARAEKRSQLLGFQHHQRFIASSLSLDMDLGREAWEVKVWRLGCLKETAAKKDVFRSLVPSLISSPASMALEIAML